MIRKRIAILGAGISGLSLAWFLKKKHGNSIDLTVIEKTNRAGGWIRTIKKEGFHFELGPHSFRADKNTMATLRLIEELGIQNQIILPATSQRYLLINQKLTLMPQNFKDTLFSPMRGMFFSAICRDLLARKSIEEDETVFDFAMRRFGKRAAETFVDSLVLGIYAGDIKKLSVKSCFPKLFDLEKKCRSILLGMIFGKKKYENEVKKIGLFSLKEGMESLPIALSTHLKENLVFNVSVKGLRFHSYHVEMLLSNGQQMKVDHLYSTLPAVSLADVVGSHDFELGKMLKGMKSASVVAVSLGFRNLKLKQNGFGYLIPRQEKEMILGMVWDSCVFPQQNQGHNEVRMTVMMGGTTQPEVCCMSEYEQLEIALQAVKKHLGIDVLPDVSHVNCSQDAIPQYDVGHDRLVIRIKERFKSLSDRITLLGTSFHGVSINDCISQADLAVNL